MATRVTMASETVADPFAPPDTAVENELVPGVCVSPTGDYIALFPSRRSSVLGDASRAKIRVGGIVIDAASGIPATSLWYAGIVLVHVRTGLVRTFPAYAQVPLWPIGFSPDGRRFAFLAGHNTGVRLFVIDVDAAVCTLAAEGVQAALLALGERPAAWMDNGRLIVTIRTQASARGQYHSEVWDSRVSGSVPAEAPPGHPRLADCFESRLHIADCVDGRLIPLGVPDVYRRATASPDRRHLLVLRAKPRGQVVPNIRSWPLAVEVWEVADDGALLAEVTVSRDSPASPFLIAGTQHLDWIPSAPCSLLSVTKSSRSEALRSDAPFSEWTRLLVLEGDCIRVCWTTAGDLIALEALTESGRLRLSAVGRNGGSSRVVASYDFPLSPVALRAPWRFEIEESPGELRPLWHTPGGESSLVSADGRCLYLTGTERSVSGSRTFVTRLDLDTGATSIVFTSEDGKHERVIALLSPEHGEFLISTETHATPPRLAIVSSRDESRRYIGQTNSVRGSSSALMRRSVSLPAHAQQTDIVDVWRLEGSLRPLPLLIWLVPMLADWPYSHATEEQYVPALGMSPLFMAVEGMAVVPQLPVRLSATLSADAQIDALVEQVLAVKSRLVEAGVGAAEGCVLGGQCLGAYAAALVLTRTNVFSAGLLVSGLFNLGAFPGGTAASGFRKLWDAPEELFLRSPITMASRIGTPILLMHGEHDTAPYPTESQHFFTALSSAGLPCRYVCVADEGHIFETDRGIETYRSEIRDWCQSYAPHGSA